MASPEPRASPIEPAQKLLLPADTSITCPKCKNTFGLEQGFARAALEQFAHSTEGALEAVRRVERAEADKRAQQLAGQQANVLREENAELKRLLKKQGEEHAQALKEVTKLAQQSAAPQLEAMRAELAARQARIDDFTRRESELGERERGLEARIAEAAQKRADSLVADERVLLETRLAEKERQLGELDSAELRKRLTDMQEQLAEAQRKGAQGSQQLQGEVLELTLQED